MRQSRDKGIAYTANRATCFKIYNLHGQDLEIFNFHP